MFIRSIQDWTDIFASNFDNDVFYFLYQNYSAFENLITVFLFFAKRQVL